MSTAYSSTLSLPWKMNLSFVLVAWLGCCTNMTMAGYVLFFPCLFIYIFMQMLTLPPQALCVRMDRSQQGVAPRSCLSARPVKPRAGPLPPGASSPGMRAFPPSQQPPRPFSAGSGRPASGALGPKKRFSPPQQQRSMSPGPYGGGPKQPAVGGAKMMAENLRPRSNSSGDLPLKTVAPLAPAPSPLGGNPSVERAPSPAASERLGSMTRKPVPGRS
jgi:hypothetical protein